MILGDWGDKLKTAQSKVPQHVLGLDSYSANMVVWMLPYTWKAEVGELPAFSIQFSVSQGYAVRPYPKATPSVLEL